MYANLFVIMFELPIISYCLLVISNWKMSLPALSFLDLALTYILRSLNCLQDNYNKLVNILLHF